MIGAVLHSQQVDLITRSQRSRAGRDRGRDLLQHCRDAARSIRIRLPGRLVFATLLIFAFVLGSVMCGPAEHLLLEAQQPTLSQVALVDSATASGVDAEIAQAPLGHTTPTKSPAPLCTGHCAAHFMSLPVQFAQAVAPFELPIVWEISHDRRVQISDPSRLERPPRV
jgi:hypothetical protein